MSIIVRHGVVVEHLFLEVGHWGGESQSIRKTSFRDGVARFSGLCREHEFRAFIDDVQKGGFPGPEQLVSAPEGLIDGFLEAVEAD